MNRRDFLRALTSGTAVAAVGAGSLSGLATFFERIRDQWASRPVTASECYPQWSAGVTASSGRFSSAKLEEMKGIIWNQQGARVDTVVYGKGVLDDARAYAAEIDRIYREANKFPPRSLAALRTRTRRV